MCDQRLNNSVILISLSRQQVRYGPYCPSPPSACPPQTSFSTFSSFLCPSTSFHPLEPAVFLFLYQGLTFFSSLSLHVPPCPSPSFSLVSSFFSAFPCHLPPFLPPLFFFFLIQLFVPSLPLSGVSGACLPVCEISERAVVTSC